MSQGMLFWIVTAALASAVALPMVLVLLRRKADLRDAADFDIAVYRDQLAEVDRDLERGTITEEVAERTRIEVSRRILEADRARAATARESAPRAATLVAGLLAAIVVVGGSLLLYAAIGAPGYGDLPLERRLAVAEIVRENRPDQATAEAQLPPSPPLDAAPDYIELVARLREKVAERPGDVRGLQLLAANEANLGNYRAAYDAMNRLIAVLGNDAPAGAHAQLAEFYIRAADGYVSPEAEAALRVALERDPAQPDARYLMGVLYIQTGRPDLGFRMWQPLAERGPFDAPWMPSLRANIEAVAAQAGIRYELPDAPQAPATPPMAGLPGPTAEDMAAARDMSPEDRMAMVEGMVAQLGERLATEGGDASEWARMIGALGVLGRTEQAAAVYEEAQQVFAADPAALAGLREAADRAGLAP